MIVELFGYDVELDESRSAASDQEIHAQVAEYETGDRRRFDVPVTVPENHTTPPNVIDRGGAKRVGRIR